MSTDHTVVLLGGTGRTGRLVLHQLLERGVAVRAIVRSADKLGADARHRDLTVIETSLLSLSDEELQRHVRGCDAVVSCLGHVLDLRGVFGPPLDLVARATSRVCRAIDASRPEVPIKVVLMSSVSVNRAGGLDTRRGPLDKALLQVLRVLLPPARDNQRAADVLQRTFGAGHPFVEWVVVRPDSLLPGDVSEYALHEGIVTRLSAPNSTRMANVAHFMCELVTNADTWASWKGKLPVIVDAAPGAPRA